MNLDQVTIRPMRSDELDAVVNIRVVGFGGEPEQAITALTDNPRYDLSHIFVADYDGILVGTGTAFPAKMWLSGVPLNVGAVAGVAVLPDFRNKGVAGKMMEYLVQHMWAEDYALSVLFPFSHKYYARYGYGTISDLHAYRFSPGNIAVSGDTSKVRPFTPEDVPMLRVVYKGQMTWHNGWFTRSNAWWSRLAEHWVNGVVFDDDGMIDGYYFYDTTIGPDGEQILFVKELFSGSPEAYQALLGHLAAQHTFDVIEYLAPADTPLRHSLHQPVAENAITRHWLFNDLCHITPGPSGRIINLAQALTTRFYTRGMSGERVLKVNDPILAENNVPIVFRLVDGRAETRPPDANAVPDIETDIVTLSQVLCGYLKAVDALRLGRFKTDVDTCSWLDKITTDSPLFIQAGDWF